MKTIKYNERMSYMNISLLQKLIAFDKSLTFFFINAPHPWLMNIFFGFFSVKGVYISIWTIIFLYLIVFEGKRHKKFIIYFIMSTLISSVSVTAIKHFTQRPRPLNQIKNEKSRVKNLKPMKQILTNLTNYPTDYSFPSGHATISFAAATILSAFDKKRKRYFYLLAVLISFSRVYLGYHYILDIFIGAFLGLIIAQLILIHQSHHLL